MTHKRKSAGKRTQRNPKLHRLEDGSLPAYAWPGGYPLYYIDKQGDVLCPTCANRDVDPSQAVTAGDVNWEDAHLYCDDCGQRIPSAYADE